MGDSTSAGTFAEIYNHLAKSLDKQEPAVKADRLKLAKKLRKMEEQLDFNDGDLECDAALIKLGIAEKCNFCKGVFGPREKDYHGAGECD